MKISADRPTLAVLGWASPSGNERTQSVFLRDARLFPMESIFKFSSSLYTPKKFFVTVANICETDNCVLFLTDYNRIC